MILRPARHADLPAVRALLGAAALPADGLKGALATMFVAVRRGVVVGAGAIEPLGRTALLRSVVVAPDCRGRRWGARLAARLLDLAQRLGCSEVFLLTTTSTGFFARLGFADLGRGEAPALVRAHAQFTASCPASAVLMRRTLAMLAPALTTRPASAAPDSRGGFMKITVIPNGPLLIETVGEWHYTGEGGPTRKNDRIAFCRCGASAVKPFCDGAHKTSGFSAGGGECQLTPR